MSSKIKLGIIFGGKSGEHEVSLLSAASVMRNIDKNKYEITPIGITKQGEWLRYEGETDAIEDGRWEAIARKLYQADPEKYAIHILGGKKLKDSLDVIFPVLHGPFGEDGTIQGLFEMADIPYVGCGVLGSSVAMDKGISKELFSRAGLPVCEYRLVYRKDFIENPKKVLTTIEEEFSYPLFIKPANLGSSVGISKAHDGKELLEGLEEACKYDRRVIIEAFVNCREIEIAVIGNDTLKVSAIGEIIASKEFYDYEAKYLSDGKSKMCIPADITDHEAEKIEELAIKAYKALDCSGLSRVDFFISKDTGEIFINEINTMPGFTAFSMVPLLWKEKGVAYGELIDILVEYAFERYSDKKKNILEPEV